MLKEIKNGLAFLGLKDNEIKVYIALTQLGEASAAKIAAKSGLPRTTAISILNKLAKENYLATHRHRGITYYWVESPQTIVSGLETKVKIASDLSSLLSSLYRAEAQFPHALMYDTKPAIRNFIEKTLSNMKKGETIYTIDTPSAGNYMKIFSENIETAILGKKSAKGILTKTLVPCGSFGLISPHKLKIQNIELREMPKDINFKASLWLIGDMLIHFSGHPPFVVAVRHEQIVSGIKSLFNYLWNVSGAVGRRA